MLADGGNQHIRKRRRRLRKGTNGVSTNGVTAFLMFLTEGLFVGLPLSYSDLPKSARAYLFPQSVKIHYFCSGPFSVDPICPQPEAGAVVRPPPGCRGRGPQIGDVGSGGPLRTVSFQRFTFQMFFQTLDLLNSCMHTFPDQNDGFTVVLDMGFETLDLKCYELNL